MKIPSKVTKDTHPIHSIADFIAEEFDEAGEESWWDYLLTLPESLRYLNAVVGYTCEVDNGGHHQYFWNTAGVNITTVTNGLRFYGAIEHLAIFERALQAYRPEDYEDEHFVENPEVLNKRGYEERRFHQEDELYFKLRPDLVDIVDSWLHKNSDVFQN